MSLLTALLNTADNWLVRHTAEFDPFRWDTPEEREYRRKAFSELSTYLYVAEELGPDADPDLRSHFRDCVRDDRYHEVMSRYITDFLQHGLPIAYLIQNGNADVQTRQRFESVANHPAVLGKQRTPYREFDLARMRMLGGLSPGIDVNTVVSRSSFTQPPDIIHSETEDAYALTHDILFCFDFGVENYTIGSQLRIDEESILTGLILRYISTGHTDLVGELLLTGVITDQLPLDVIQFAVEWLWSVTEERGYTPGPDSLSGVNSSSDPESSLEAIPESWKQNYHTTLVAGITGRVLSDRGISGSGSDKEKLLHLLGATVDAFAGYRLREGAEYLQQASELAIPQSLSPIVRRLIEFLEGQRRNDGKFGYWPDERDKFLSSGGTDSEFESGPVARTSTACSGAISKVKSDTGIATESISEPFVNRRTEE